MLALFLLQVLLVSFHVDDDIKWNYSDRKSTSEKKSSIASSYLHLSVWVRETSSTILFLQHSDSDKKSDSQLLLLSLGKYAAFAAKVNGDSVANFVKLIPKGVLKAKCATFGA